jgi:hypothetical protein
MSERTIKSFVIFSDNSHQEYFNNLTLPVSLEINNKENIEDNELDLFIGDIEGFSSCFDWLSEKQYWPNQIILLKDGFEPKLHIKKETILIDKLDDLLSSDLWRELRDDDEISLYINKKISFGINSIYEVGGVIDEINYNFEKLGHGLLNIHHSIFNLAQFVSSLFFNKSITKPACFKLTTYDNSPLIDLELRILNHHLDPSFLLEYMQYQEANNKSGLLFSSFSSASFSKVNFSENNLVIQLRYDNESKGNIVFLKIDKLIKSLVDFTEPEALSSESSGILLGLSRERENYQADHPGIKHKPNMTRQRKEDVEALVVRVLGYKENYNDIFDLSKVKNILEDDPAITISDYSDDELQRICDISNDAESTVVLARAKEDVLNQIINDDDLELEIINVIDNLTEDDLPLLITGRSEVSLEDDGTVTVKAPESITINDDIIIVKDEEIEKDQLNQKIRVLNENIKEEVLKVKGQLRNKDDINSFISRIIGEKAPDLAKYETEISNNIVSSFLSNQMNNIVHSNKKWEKMNEMIKSFQKKIEQRDKQISVMNSTIDTLKYKKSEMHPVFKEIVNNNDNEANAKSIDKTIERKNQYIKKLEGKLIDSQFGDIKVIKGDAESIISNEVVFRKGDKDKNILSAGAQPELSNEENNKEKEEMLEIKHQELVKYKNIGRTMARKLGDLNEVLRDYKTRNTELLIERNNLHKEKQRLNLLDKRAVSKVIDFKNKLSKAEQIINNKKESEVEQQAARESILNIGHQKKVSKLEDLNEKLSDGAKSLARKLTHLQIEHSKIKNEKKSLSKRLKHSENELEKYKETLKSQLIKNNKAS